MCFSHTIIFFDSVTCVDAFPGLNRRNPAGVGYDSKKSNTDLIVDRSFESLGVARIQFSKNARGDDVARIPKKKYKRNTKKKYKRNTKERPGITKKIPTKYLVFSKKHEKRDF